MIWGVLVGMWRTRVSLEACLPTQPSSVIKHFATGMVGEKRGRYGREGEGRGGVGRGGELCVVPAAHFNLFSSVADYTLNRVPAELSDHTHQETTPITLQDGLEH